MSEWDNLVFYGPHLSPRLAQQKLGESPLAPRSSFGYYPHLQTNTKGPRAPRVYSASERVIIKLEG